MNSTCYRTLCNAHPSDDSIRSCKEGRHVAWSSRRMHLQMYNARMSGLMYVDKMGLWRTCSKEQSASPRCHLKDE